jgi:hypothetical protein
MIGVAHPLLELCVERDEFRREFLRQPEVTRVIGGEARFQRAFEGGAMVDEARWGAESVMAAAERPSF